MTDIVNEYYGTKAALRITAIFYGAMALAGYVVELIFTPLGLVPTNRHLSVVDVGISWNYTTWLNIIFITLGFILLTVLAKWTTFGRHVYAVGGNAEAARRAGISVQRIKVLVFVISGATAGMGGIIFASQVNSVALTFPPGNLLLNAIAYALIGGVSAFGGRGAG